MTDHHVFEAATISPEVIRLMATVFDDVATERGLSPRNDPICDLVAEAILDCARRGCRDASAMRRCAYEALGIAQAPAAAPTPALPRPSHAA
jgi:hypothetical protein